MDLASEKINLIEWLVHLKNEKIINLLLTIKNKENLAEIKKVDLSDFQSKLLKMPILDEFEDLRIAENRNQLNKSLKK